MVVNPPQALPRRPRGSKNYGKQVPRVPEETHAFLFFEFVGYYFTVKNDTPTVTIGADICPRM